MVDGFNARQQVHAISSGRLETAVLFVFSFLMVLIVNCHLKNL